MLSTTKSNFSTDYLRQELNSLSKLRTHIKPAQFLIAIPLILLLSFAINIAVGIEYTGQDFLVRGPRIFSWLKVFLPAHEINLEDATLHPELPLFANGRMSIGSNAVRQNGVYDCRFLAALASFAESNRGKDAIERMTRTNGDGSYTVTFDGAPKEPITVAPLSGLELRIYSRAVGPDGYSAGVWVPVIEKAYGTYLDRHQTLDEKIFHFVRHAIIDGRFTSSPELPGFAASFGARDERGCKVLTGSDTDQLATTNMELGDFGLGKGYVTLRQVESWFNRQRVVSEIYDEQDLLLTVAMMHNRIVVATTGIQEYAEVYGLMQHHAYAVIGYDSTNRKILIRDVLNKSFFVKPETQYLFQDSDLSKPFWMTLPEFNKCFSGISIEQYPSISLHG